MIKRVTWWKALFWRVTPQNHAPLQALQRRFFQYIFFGIPMTTRTPECFPLFKFHSAMNMKSSFSQSSVSCFPSNGWKPKKTKVLWSGTGGRSYIEFLKVNLLVLCECSCWWIFLHIKHYILKTLICTCLLVYNLYITTSYLWYAWVESLWNHLKSIMERYNDLEQCRCLFMWLQLCLVYLLNCTQPAMVTVEIYLSHGHVIEGCHIMPRTLCSRACLKPCHVPFPCNVLTSAPLLIW